MGCYDWTCAYAGVGILRVEGAGAGGADAREYPLQYTAHLYGQIS